MQTSYSDQTSYSESSDSNFSSRMHSIASQHESRKRFSINRLRFLHWRNYFSLQIIRRKLSKFPAGLITLIPASRWLFDNYHLLYRNFKVFQSSGSVEQFGKMPIIISGPMKGYPCIYLIAREIIFASNRHLTEDSVVQMVREYQSVKMLSEDELNLMSDMIVFCLLERVIEEAKKIIPAIRSKAKADRLIEKMSSHFVSGDVNAFSLLKSKIKPKDLREHTFRSHLIYRLRSLSINQQDISDFFKSIFVTTGELDLDSDIILKTTEKERHFEAESESAISSYITSLDEISGMDKDIFVSEISLIEDLLSNDPAGIYSNMSKSTRARYRSSVAKISEQHKLTEIEVAGLTLNFSVTPPENSDLPAQNHVGTYLEGPGRAYLISAITGKKVKGRDLLSRVKKFRQIFYFLGILIITAAFYPALEYFINPAGKPIDTGMIIFYIAVFIPASGFAVTFMNSIFTRIIHPKSPLSMDFEKEIPDNCKTFIVIPLILPSVESSHEYAQRLEQHYLVNRMNNLFFALLVDFKDSKEKTLPEDMEIIDSAIEEINKLNALYPRTHCLFSLFYRERVWNEGQNCWMGWERKRGKLEDFNSLIAGETDTGFLMPVGDASIFKEIKYVITLDSDTELTNGSASEMIGAMEHPLNQPVFDLSGQKIKSGYVIIQSEVRNRAPSPSSGISQRIFSGESGFDPYSAIVSDVYQDTFDEGIYAGKGIYNLNAFHTLLHNKIPENHVLSHDLLEASFTRCAFASGIKMMNAVPSSVSAYIKREHRWVRGDWQLVKFLFSKSEINLLSRWKMADNLRRSLLPSSLMLLMVASLFLIPMSRWIWIPFIFYETITQLSGTLISLFFEKIRHPFRRISLPVLWNNIYAIIMQAVFFFVLLPCRAATTLDAIIRTLYRVFISHKNLLEWQTADSLEKTESNSLKNYMRLMMPSYLVASVILFRTVFPLHIALRILFVLFALLWIMSPLITYFSSKSKHTGVSEKLTSDEKDILLSQAARIWNYFADFTKEENHWLCPDHHQESPGPKTENKTSPTNIGLQLLATLSARDLGFIGFFTFLETCERIMFTVEQMPKWYGHLYNWYDTKTLQILEPKYISTVDSGNFFAHIIALRSALSEMVQSPLYNDALIEGLRKMQIADIEEPEISGAEFYKMSKGVSKKKPRNKVTNSVNKVCIPILPDISSDKSPAAANNRIVIKIHSMFEAVQKLINDPNTGTRTMSLCSDLIQDKEQLGLTCDEEFAEPLYILLQNGNEQVEQVIFRLDNLISKIDNLVKESDFRPLYDRKKQLFRIGYHETNKKLDRGHYNLMASEARLSSFLAIAKGDVPKRHWAALGKPLTVFKGLPALVSWSGSMFEYLMPNIVMKTPHNSIIDYSCRASVHSQISYARRMKMPWGISESQYHVFDNHANYQYGPFGVVRMRLQSTLKPVRVVAPYSTYLALDTYPKRAIKNLVELDRIGASGKYGFYEALDFNSPDPVTLRKYFLVRSFMAHHLGMSITSINNVLNNKILQTRFHENPMIKASESMLEDNFKSNLVTIASQGYTIDVDSKDIATGLIESRTFTTTNTPYPIAHILSNGNYQLMLTTQGNGFSSCNDTMINRWRPNFRDGGYGSFIYIRDTEANSLWSNTFYPVMNEPDSYKVIFSYDKVEYRRTDGQISTSTEITLSPVDQLEIRRITLTNHSEKTVNIELTSYIELCANDYMADVSHQAYSKLFIETQFDANRKFLVSKRRSKKPTETNGYIMHQIRTDARISRPVHFETDRQSFIGRSGTLMAPEILSSNIPFSDRIGTSIDPILSLQVVISISPGRSSSVSFITAYCKSMAEVTDLSDRYSARFSDDDTFKMARTSSLLEIEYLKIQSSQINAIQDLVGPLYYPTEKFKDIDDQLSQNFLGQNTLWKFGISGDQPVILLKISEVSEMEILKDVLFVYEFLRLQKIRVDLIILNEQEDSYDNRLHQLIFEQTATIRVFDEGRYQSGIFVLRSTQIAPEERLLLLAVSRIVFSPKSGIYFSKLKKSWPKQEKSLVIHLPSGTLPRPSLQDDISHHLEPVPEFFNGIGGFVDDGREYEIRLTKGTKTPAPWINVIANEHFGFQVSETGAGYVWAVNSRENKLTTWHNDPVLDPQSEAIYVKSNLTGAVSSPCSMKAGAHGPFIVRHGFGYSVFEKRDPSLNESMTVFACSKEPIKLSILTLKNLTETPMDLTITYFVEWVLGAFREQTARFITTQVDENNQILYARNCYSEKSNENIAFIFSSEDITSYTGNMQNFLGKNGTIRYPLELSAKSLSGEVGYGYDPCGAIQCICNVLPGESKTIVFGLGQSTSINNATNLAERFGDLVNASAELKTVKKYWSRLPGDVTIKTPDRAMDILMNGWLLYQVLSCRILAKAAFYQCGGAFGFRDQLQDVLALVNFDPLIARNHILKCCSKQFTEGDVQHWWHEPDGVGVRTRISDNLLWLPYITAQYCNQTGDFNLLDEKVSFLEEKVLEKNQSEYVSRPRVSETTAKVYAHCVMAIDYACRFGVHGLPLMKGGDWNDGMNLVGPQELGESVWLGWFIYSILNSFIPICQMQGENDRAASYQIMADKLKSNLDKNSWDGEWYLRAFYDNGQMMGSTKSEDCRIDSISQSWAVISQGADKYKAQTALNSARRYLIKPEDGIVLLLTPPFDKDTNNPGYIKGYNPGIRENGGQYTHAAVWLAMAFCEAGDGNEAYRILNIINPIQSTRDFQSVSHYTKEPYVMSADVSYGFPNTGKGGWSWYTGAAGWMYRTILHNFLGVRKEGNQLIFEPCISSNFRRFQVEYQFGLSLYEITVLNDYCNGCEVTSLSIDGVMKNSNKVDLIDDGLVHHIEIRLGNV